ncbi:hypothetical protein TCAL_14559 [Tigriopus californicus]|uniref:Uncharacterized protein n=1 Tax=Tigriopus californicus TaxID=6832 RepID=A0A553PCU0_TIGCA|nr:hypothetical protein TCAL_14559 [Tigriopus californicus]
MISQIWLRTSGHIQFHDPPTFGPLKVKSKDEDHIKIVSHVIHQLDPNLGLSLASTPEVKGLQRLEAMKYGYISRFMDRLS